MLDGNELKNGEVLNYARRPFYFADPALHCKSTDHLSVSIE
jgi:hypothetical protein